MSLEKSKISHVYSLTASQKEAVKAIEELFKTGFLPTVNYDKVILGKISNVDVGSNIALISIKKREILFVFSFGTVEVIVTTHPNSYQPSNRPEEDPDAAYVWDASTATVPIDGVPYVLTRLTKPISHWVLREALNRS